MVKDLLVEIGTEELPPKSLDALSQAFERGLQDSLSKLGLATGEIHRYATPRRLAVLVHDVPVKQPDRHQERRGPSIGAAYDQNGKPTKAAMGFAHSCGVDLSELQTVESEKGAWLVHTWMERGAATTELIPSLIQTVLTDLPIPKRMRWGVGDYEFVRPVHWLLLLFGNEIIPATLFGVSADAETRGHRFHHPASMVIPEPTIYAPLLENEGKVIADFAARRETVRNQADAAARRVKGRAVINPKLLDEVTALVEWPVALVGNFDQRFLNVPAEVLMTTMQDNQKYFPVVDAAMGRLMPHFIAIANLESHDPDQVKAGNERVIRPRFSDAEFFWIQDRKHALASHLETLKHVIFQKQLGSLYDKSERVSVLARFIAEHSGGNPDWAERAARLAKCDLLTQMVQEFPELQGIMGRYYAHYDGEADEVAQAQEEQYRPRFAGDRLPHTATGKALALADRLDTLIGIFAIGQAPSGAKDPFALRRMGLGVLRILIEGEMPLNLKDLLKHAADPFDARIKAKATVTVVFDFMMERLRSYYMERGVRPDNFEAVLECQPTCPLDFDRRIHAVADFRKLPEAESLATANKRIRNILKKVETPLPFKVHADLLIEDPEQTLAGRLAELSSEVIPLMETGLYGEALTRLAALREPVDSFFDQVLVMTDDQVLRNNRIALLNELSNLFLRVADFSRLQD